MFILPSKIITWLEKRLRQFLWDSGGTARGKAKVAWEVCCRPKVEGGLGIRRVEDMNKSLVSKHIWSLLSNRKSLWVSWVHSYRIKEANFWELPLRSGVSWGWRKIMQLRNEVRPFVMKKIGDGRTSWCWSDKWNRIGPLNSFISTNLIRREGFRISSSVRDVFEGAWVWPDAWKDLFPVLITMDSPMLTDGVSDRVIWCDRDGREVPFSARAVWENIRVRGQEVEWHSLVWSSKLIPKHSFITWLFMHRKLKTQDILKPWEVGGQVNLNLLCCVLCYQDRESQDHLFFECPYSRYVWSTVVALSGLDFRIYNSQLVMDWLLLQNSKQGTGMIGRLLFSVSIYVIWVERNKRMFKNHARPPERVISQILELVRIRAKPCLS